MQKVIQLRCARPDVAGMEAAGHAPVGRPAGSIRTVMDTLSRTLEHIKALCASLPEGKVRGQLEAEQARLIVDLSAVRQAAARLAVAELDVTATSRISAIALPRI